MDTVKLQKIRSDFPITERRFVAPDGSTRQVIYLDHGASTQPPRTVLDHYYEFLERYYANIHRGRHYLSQRSSDLFDEVTRIILRFLGADPETKEVIFATNTTGAIDIAAHLVSTEDGATIVTDMEHHSNDLPHRRRSNVLRCPVDEQGKLDYERLESLLTGHKVKLVAVTGASNVTGYLPDLPRIARAAHDAGARILVDAAQLLAHRSIDIKSSDDPEHIDFLAAAGHKAYAPFGAAFLVAPKRTCDRVAPYLPGGGTVRFVSSDDVIWALGQDRHVGGTPNIAGVIALGRAISWLDEIGLDWVEEHERELGVTMFDRLAAIPGLRLLGDIAPSERLAVASFEIEGIRDAEVSTILNNRFGIATRNGCFCAHPYLAQLLGVGRVAEYAAALRRGEDPDLPGAVRATLGVYNDEKDVDHLVAALEQIASNPKWGEDVDIDTDLRCHDYA